MKDLIYRQDAIDALEKVDWYHQNKDKDMVLGANPPEHQAWYKEDDIFKTLEALPSAQPEIIRCKDCKWYKTNYSWNGKEHKVCVIEPYEPIRKGDDFCSRAERRTDE